MKHPDDSYKLTFPGRLTCHVNVACVGVRTGLVAFSAVLYEMHKYAYHSNAIIQYDDDDDHCYIIFFIKCFRHIPFNLLVLADSTV